MKMIYMTIGLGVIGILATSAVAQKDEASGQGRVTLPGIEIKRDGVTLPGIEINRGGVKLPGISIEKGGRSAPQSPAGQEFLSTDLKGADFSGQNLVGARFISTDVTQVDFSGADLTDAYFSGTDLKNANFTGANLTRATFQGVDMKGADFSRACLLQASMTGSDLGNAKFDGAIMVGAQLVGVDRAGASFVGTIWRGPSQCPGKVAAVPSVQTERPDVTRASQIRMALADTSNGGRVDLTVNFRLDSDKIEAAGHAQILEIANALRESSLQALRIRVEGHTDSSGDEQYNLDLSYRRAIRVVRTLTQEYGIEPDRLEVKGYGESQPIASNQDERGRSLNRRVTLVNIGTR